MFFFLNSKKFVALWDFKYFSFSMEYYKDNKVYQRDIYNLLKIKSYSKKKFM